jgi:phosphoesterase RecJ-like protein
MIAEYKRKVASDLIYEADVIFCLDFNAPSRIGFWETGLKFQSEKILIDHHQQPENLILFIPIP